jgi:hypothetical protein
MSCTVPAFFLDFQVLLAIFLSFCSQFCEFCSQLVNFSSFFHQNSTIFMSFKEVRKVRARTPQNPHISITHDYLSSIGIY